MSTSTAVAALAGVPLFTGLSEARREVLVEEMHERAVAAGTEIITQAEPGDAIFVVVSGSVKVYRRRVEGGEVILSVLGPGAIVGESGAVDARDRWASVAAIEDSVVLWLEGERFRRLLDEEPSVRTGLIELLCGRLRSADARVESLAALDVEGRVACVLLALADEHGEPKPGGGARIPLPLSQADLASMTGASRVRVNQTLAKFRRHGWVTLDGRRRISVQDPAALEARCR